MGIVGVVFWGLVLRIVLYVCGRTCLSSAESEQDWATVAFGLFALFFAVLIFFFNPFAILVWYQTMIMPLSPMLPALDYWTMFWIIFAYNLVTSKIDFNFKKD